MIALVKAIPMGAMLTLLVTLFIGSAGSGGGVLDVFRFTVELHWSWLMFYAATGIAWSLMLLMGD